MTTRVFIETQATEDAVRTALAPNGITVAPAVTDGDPRGYPHEFTADVPDSRDAEEEVTDALNEAGITAFVHGD